MATQLVTTIKSILGEIVVCDRRYKLDEELCSMIDALRKKNKDAKSRISELEKQVESLTRDYIEMQSLAEVSRKRYQELCLLKQETEYKLLSRALKSEQEVSDILDSIQSVITKFKQQ